MEQNELDLMPDVEETDTVSGDNPKKESLWRRVCAHLPQAAIWARYLLPFVTLLVLFVMSFFYNVKVYVEGVENEVCVLRLYLNTFKGTYAYLGGTTATGRSWFYGIVTAGAIVGILLFLIALFLTGLAAYTAVRVFLLGHESEKSDKMKLIFKIAFPNRVWLFVADLTVLLPFLYPHFFSYVGGKFLAVGGESVIFILLNRPLLVGAVMLALTLLLAFLIPKYERRKKMNMFLLHRTEETEVEENEEAS